LIPILVAFLLLGSLSNEADAQGPDIRNIRPHVMLLVDTSGSMERLPECICSTPACLECLPVCSAPTFEQNRWSIVAQALTGEFTPFECNSETRIGGIYTGQYDEGYFLPHVQLPQELVPAYTGTQSGNGILDTYLERIKFGLMTFDAIGTLSDQPPLVPQTTFETAPFPADSAGNLGMYSYGDNKPFSFPSALTTYMINSGARDYSAPEGGLVSVGADSTASMTAINASIQATILGDSGLGKNPLRPFGATPTDALIDDLQYFLQNDPDIIQKVSAGGPGDAFYGCRPRSAILITDGFPNGVMRGDPVNCQNLGQPPGASGCPYPESADIVSDMISAGELDQFYVIGFALDVSNTTERLAVEALLNDIASVGDTDSAYFVNNRDELVSALSQILNEQNPGATSRTAPVQTGLTPGLVQAEFISGFNVSADATDPWDGILERRRIECQNGVPVAQDVEDRDRFDEVLNNQSAAPGAVTPYSSGASVSFTGGFSRNLWTIVPADPANINGYLIGNGEDKLTALSSSAIDLPTNTGLEVRNVAAGEFSSTLSPEYFFGVGSTDTAGRDAVVDWIHGVAGTDRDDERLGDIYHSTPAIVGPLIDDLEDASYNDWRLGLGFQESPDGTRDPGWQLSERPRVIYASTNDGIIHAFLADDYGATAFDSGNDLDEFSCANGKAAGTELWGFIPPMFLDDLDDLLVGGSKQWFADGNIQIRNVYDVRTFSQSDGSGGVEDSPAGQTNVWRTILFLSFRNGGQGMVALDVTNPCEPEFLWQFTDPNLGDTYGQPTAAQIFIEDSSPTPQGNAGGPVVFNPRQSRGVILLPGGQGVEDAGASPCTYTTPGPELPQGMESATGATITPRSDRRCWRGTTSSPAELRHGRSLYFIDLITGTIIREIGEDRFPAPLNGAVSVFRGDTGTVGSVAYTVDADGIVWRIDMSSADPEDWDAEALHDLYYDGAYDDAEPTYYPPALTINSDGEIVVLVGTGNIDVLDDDTAVNQVVSITEQLTFDGTGFVDQLDGRLNWEIELLPGEQMTGPLELFGGQVYFGTFKSGTGSAVNACPLGTSRIFGVNFLDDPTSPGDLVPLLQDGSNQVEFLDATNVPELSNALLVGLQVAQQPVCTLTQSINVIDPFTGASRTLAMPYATSGREFKLMGHLSGSSALSGGLSIAILEENIGAPEGFTVVSAMAETLE
jgi:type IV pilus assembly protein PilY1